MTDNFYRMTHTPALLLGLLLGFGPALSAQPNSTRFASRNAIEKVCLELEHETRLKDTQSGRFHLFSSNCSIDRDFYGSWERAGDTLSLTTDKRPSINLESVTETGVSTDQVLVSLRSDDPALLPGLTAHHGDQTFRVGASGTVTLNVPLTSVFFSHPGMAKAVYIPVNTDAAEVTISVRFLDLHLPSLVDDRWLLQGKHMVYVPRAGSLRSEQMTLHRGKRCFYPQE